MKLALLASLFVFSFSEFSEAGRIRLRKVKESPKVCAHMVEDNYLSRKNRKVYGTLRNSLIIEDQVLVVDDLGQKICQWPSEKWATMGDLTKYKFYIDEKRNKIYSYLKNAEANQYQVAEVDINNCQLGSLQTVPELDLPKCEKVKKSKNKSKSVQSKKVTSSKKSVAKASVKSKSKNKTTAKAKSKKSVTSSKQTIRKTASKTAPKAVSN